MMKQEFSYFLSFVEMIQFKFMKNAIRIQVELVENFWNEKLIKTQQQGEIILKKIL
jgi:hypothetical protein